MIVYTILRSKYG